MKRVAGWVFPLLVVAACGDDGSGGGGGAIPEGYVRLASEGQTDEVSEGVARFYDFADGSRLSIAIERGASCDGARIPEPGELTLSIFVPEALATDGKHSIRLDTAHVTASVTSREEGEAPLLSFFHRGSVELVFGEDTLTVAVDAKSGDLQARGRLEIELCTD